MKRILGAVLVVLASSCATTSAVGRAVNASELTLEEAQNVVAAYEHRRELRHAEVASDALGQPKSLDDVLEILRRDQTDFFPEALKFASTQQGPQALALRAQIELAWGDADVVLDEMLTRSTANLRGQLNELEVKRSSGALTADETTRYQTLRKTIDDLGGLGEALVRVGGKHISSGADLAQTLIAQAPSDYHGYRVAADYYRLRGDWARFDEMMTKLEASNPNSNGGLFLRGMEALQRKGDRSAAQKFFTQALERDPKFARARVQLLLAQTDLVSSRDELEQLRSISPHHQLVRWVGPAIETYYQSWTQRQRSIQDTRMQNQVDAAEIKDGARRQP